MIELPLIIIRFLTYGIQIYPFRIKYVLKGYEQYKIPDDRLEQLNKEELIIYENALFLSQQENTYYWRQGFDKLKELGFIEESYLDGHRRYIKMVYRHENPKFI